MDNSDSRTTEMLDRTAILLSGLCVVHCIAFPLLIVAAPFLGQFTEGHFHAQMLVIVLPLSTAALAFGFRRHKSTKIIITGGIGMLLLLVGGTIMHDQFGIVADRVFTMSGALVLGISHWWNSRAGNRACKPSPAIS